MIGCNLKKKNPPTPSMVEDHTFALFNFGTLPLEHMYQFIHNPKTDMLRILYIDQLLTYSHGFPNIVIDKVFNIQLSIAKNMLPLSKNKQSKILIFTELCRLYSFSANCKIYVHCNIVK